MIPEEIDTGLENPEAAFRALASNMLPLMQLAGLGHVDHQLATQASYVLKAWHPLASLLSAHADHLDSHRDKLKQLDRLAACGDKLLAKEGLSEQARGQAHHFVYHVRRLRADYECRYIHRRRPDCTYDSPPQLRLVKDEEG